MTQDLEKTLWATADKLRNNMDAAEYKHVVLGLIFLKYISDSFEELFEKLKQDKHSDPRQRRISGGECILCATVGKVELLTVPKSKIAGHRQRH